MRAMPGMTVAAPGDPEETSAVLADLLAHGGPAYLRLGKAGEPTVHPGRRDLARGAVDRRCAHGDDVACSRTGRDPRRHAAGAADLLDGDGISARVMLGAPGSRRSTSAPIRGAAASHGWSSPSRSTRVVGGLGGAVAEVLAEAPEPACALMRIGAARIEFSSVVGDQDYLRSRLRARPGRSRAGSRDQDWRTAMSWRVKFIDFPEQWQRQRERAAADHRGHPRPGRPDAAPAAGRLREQPGGVQRLGPRGRGQQLHRRAAPAGARPRHRPRRRGGDGGSHLHRHRSRRSCCAAPPRSSSTSGTTS